MLAAIYARESAAGEKAPPLSEQIARVKAFADNPPIYFWNEFQGIQDKTLQLPTSLIFMDEAISGGTKARPGYQGMMEAAKQGRFRILLVWHTNRIMRQTEFHLGFIRTMKELNIKVYSTNQNKFIKDETIDDFYSNVIDGMVAESFRRETSRKVKMVYEYKKAEAEKKGERCRWAGAYEMATVKKVKELGRQGLSIREIAAYLKTNKEKSPKKSWIALVLRGGIG